jgi:hypothetical protein
MGVLYWALNHDKRQAIELGKCGWGGDEFVKARTWEEFWSLCADRFRNFEESNRIRISLKLWEMGVQQIAADCDGSDWDEYCCDYMLIDSIYSDPKDRDQVGKKVGQWHLDSALELIKPEWLETGHPERQWYIDLYKERMKQEQGYE